MSCNHCHSRQCFIKAAVVPFALNSLKREYAGCMISYDPMFGQWPVCLLRVILWTHLGQFLQVTWRSCCNVSGTSCKLLGQDVTTYHGRLASYLTKMLQRIRNTLQVTYRRFYNLAVQRIRNVLQVTWRRCYKRIRNVLKATWRRHYNVSGTSCELLEEDITTYQERLASYVQRMLQRSRNVLEVIWRRCYNVSGTSCKLLEEDITTYQERLASYVTEDVTA